MRPSVPVLLALGLAGCTVGPRADRIRADTSAPLPPARAAQVIAPVSASAQQLDSTLAVDPSWWRAFGSAQLNALVDQALAHSSDIAAADATLNQAREQASATAGAQGPQIDANYQAQRARVSKALSTPLADANDYRYTLHTAQVTVAYPLDLFGGGRNRVRSARAAAEVARHRLVAARTTVISNLVQAAIQHAALQAQIEAQRSAIQSSRELVSLLRRRQRLGDVGAADVSAQEAALAAQEAALPPLMRQAEHQRALILTLTGVPAGSAPPPLPSLADLSLPVRLPLALPSAAVGNRPDVRAAEAQVRGAAADVGTAIAARLPQIQLTGEAGGNSLRFADLFSPANVFFTLIGGLTQPLFHSGQLRHQQRAAEAALDVAKAQYRSAALQAFLDVDDALSGLKTDAEALDAATRADAAARQTLVFTRRQVELGAVGTLQLLNASVSAAQASTQLVQARAARLTDSVALYQAMGTDSGA
jgi:NodT family efflux transporter outer membrane factor (OMF) lipoprotein